MRGDADDDPDVDVLSAVMQAVLNDAYRIFQAYSPIAFELVTIAGETIDAAIAVFENLSEPQRSLLLACLRTDSPRESNDLRQYTMSEENTERIRQTLIELPKDTHEAERQILAAGLVITS